MTVLISTLVAVPRSTNWTLLPRSRIESFSFYLAFLRIKNNSLGLATGITPEGGSRRCIASSAVVIQYLSVTKRKSPFSASRRQTNFCVGEAYRAYSALIGLPNGFYTPKSYVPAVTRDHAFDRAS